MVRERTSTLLGLSLEIMYRASRPPILCAMIFTLFPLAFAAISCPSLRARSSTDPEGGTEAMMTSIPFCRSASVIPRQ